MEEDLNTMYSNGMVVASNELNCMFHSYDCSMISSPFTELVYNIYMALNSFSKQIEPIRNKVITATNLNWIDQHQSLAFLHRNHGVKPTDIIVTLLILLSLLVLIFDGSNIIASIACFVLPLLKCIDELTGSRKPFSLSRLNASSPNSHMTDQEFSQIMANNRSPLQVAQSYTIYFVIYGGTEVLTPMMGWLLGSISWLILRILLTLLLMAKQRIVTGKVLSLLGIKGQLSPETNKYSQ